MHSLRPFWSCWHFVGSSLKYGSLRHSRGVCRCTMMHSDSWRHCARACPVDYREDQRDAMRRQAKEDQTPNSPPAVISISGHCPPGSCLGDRCEIRGYSRISLHELGILADLAGCAYLSIHESLRSNKALYLRIEIDRQKRSRKRSHHDPIRSWRPGRSGKLDAR